MQEKGKLKIGIVSDGVRHRNFVMRPETGRDSVVAYEDEEARKNDVYFGLCVLALTIESLGRIPKEKITGELLMDMHAADIRELREAKARLEQKLANFREADVGEAEEKTDSQPAQDRDTPGQG